MRFRALGALAILAALLAPPTLWADWINLTGAETAPNIAEFSVTEVGVRVAMAAGAGAMALFWTVERAIPLVGLATTSVT